MITYIDIQTFSSKYNNILILLCIIILCILIFNIIFHTNKKSLFIDIPDSIKKMVPSNTANMDSKLNKILYNKDPPPDINTDYNKICEKPSDIVNSCINYDNCCVNSGIHNDCICKHSFITKCISEYNNCIQNPESIKNYSTKQITDKCSSIKKECCISYNNIPIVNDNFNLPKQGDQTSNIICNIKFVPNIDNKCMELCQTTPECKAYSVSKMNCNLFNEITNTNDTKTETKFYTKK